MAQEQAAPDTPWHKAFPPPSLGPDQIPYITHDDLLTLLTNPSAGPRYVLVDLRRADHAGGQIRGSINLPAQSLYYSMPTLYQLFKGSGIEQIIWFCGSSRGRGPRAAGWFHDFCLSKGDMTMENVVLQGGVKGWVAQGDEYVVFMDGFDGQVWEQEEHIQQ